MLFYYLDEPIFRTLPFFQCLPPSITLDNLHENLKTRLRAIVNKDHSQFNLRLLTPKTQKTGQLGTGKCSKIDITRRYFVGTYGFVIQQVAAIFQCSIR